MARSRPTRSALAAAASSTPSQFAHRLKALGRLFRETRFDNPLERSSGSQGRRVVPQHQALRTSATDPSGGRTTFGDTTHTKLNTSRSVRPSKIGPAPVR